MKFSNVSTSLEVAVARRIVRIAEREYASTASIMRRCIMRALPEVEAEVMQREDGRVRNGRKE
mgnify:FL=1